MTLALPIAASLAIALVAAPAPAGAAHCSVPDGAQVLKRTSHVVLYTRTTRYSASELVGCGDRAGGQPVVIEIDPIDGLVLNGYELAYVRRSDYGRGREHAEVWRFDLRHPHRWFDEGGVLTGQGSASFSRLSVTHDGAVAYAIEWLGPGAAGPDGQHREVRIRDRDGLEVVDHGPAVDLDSLERHGRTVSWRHGAEERSAKLSPMDAVGRCRLEPGADVRARDATTLVYTADRIDSYWDGVTYAYACDRRTGRESRIETAGHETNDEEFDDDFRLAGRYVAWSMSSSDHYGGQWVDVEVYDLGRREFKSVTTMPGRGPEQVGPPSAIVELLLTSDGDAAWSTRSYYYPFAYDGGHAVERRFVSAYDQYGYLELDHGKAVDLGSPRLARGRVHWTHGGKERSARLWPSGRTLSCTLPAGVTRLERGTSAVIYSSRQGKGKSAIRHFYACAFANGHRTHLADAQRPDRRLHQRLLAGHFAAVTTDERVDGTQEVRVTSFDLLTGRRVWSSVAGRGHARFYVPSVVLARNGAFAYVASSDAETSWRVRARWPGGHGTLDEIGDADEWTLELHGYVASWRHGDERRSQDLR